MVKIAKKQQTVCLTDCPNQVMHGGYLQGIAWVASPSQGSLSEKAERLQKTFVLDCIPSTLLQMVDCMFKT